MPRRKILKITKTSVKDECRQQKGLSAQYLSASEEEAHGIAVKISSRFLRACCMTRLMEAQDIFVDERWEHILSVLPGDLEESARSTGSIERLRNVRSAGDMLRVMLAYDVSDLSIKDTAAWAKADNIAAFTGPALFYRLEQSQGWLQHILGQLLLQSRRVDEAAFEIRIVDATVITGPGSTGTDWVLHTVINPVAGRFESVEITDAKGAESFLRHSPRPDELVLGDRAYGTARGIDSVVSVGAHPVVRVNRRTLKVCDLDKQRIYLQSFEADLSLGGLDRKSVV